MQIENFSWNAQAIWMYEAVLHIAVAYILLCKLYCGYHNQAGFSLAGYLTLSEK